MNPLTKRPSLGSGLLFLFASCSEPATGTSSTSSGETADASTTAGSTEPTSGPTTSASTTTTTGTEDSSGAPGSSEETTDVDTTGTTTGAIDCSIGEPLDVPEDTWTWVPFPDTYCAYEGNAGIFVNPTASSRKLMIYLQGGGACFSEADCASLALWGIDDAGELANMPERAYLDRAIATNPFADYDYVFVPYCTGDFHTGDNVSSYGANHVGHANIQRFLERVVPTFCDVESIVVAGSSAGGFGATFNAPHIREAFGNTPTDLVDDSGPYLDPDWMPVAFQDQLDENWGFQANYPADCAECAEGWHGLYPYMSAKYPDMRLSLISALYDPSIQGRFAPYSPLSSPSMFRVGIEAFADGVLAPLSNMRVFFIDEGSHVYIWLPLDEVVSDGQTLEGFLRAQLAHDPDWANARP